MVRTIAELKKELDVVETTKVDLKRFIKLIRKYKDCETLTDEMPVSYTHLTSTLIE